MGTSCTREAVAFPSVRETSQSASRQSLQPTCRGLSSAWWWPATSQHVRICFPSVSLHSSAESEQGPAVISSATEEAVTSRQPSKGGLCSGGGGAQPPASAERQLSVPRAMCARTRGPKEAGFPPGLGAKSFRAGGSHPSGGRGEPGATSLWFCFAFFSIWITFPIFFVLPVHL